MRSRLKEKEKRARSAGRLSAMPEADETTDVDATQLQVVSGVRNGAGGDNWQEGAGEYDNSSYSADPVETQAIYVGHQQYAEPNYGAASAYGYPNEPQQEPVTETKCALFIFNYALLQFCGPKTIVC